MARVLLTGFCAVPGPRRAGVQLRHVVRALAPLHAVDVLVMREGDQAYVERQGTGRVLRVPTQDADLRGQIQAYQRALKRQLDGADYDIVHCRDSWSCMPVLEARERLGLAVVYDLSRSPLGETTFDAELDAQYGRDEEACLLAADLVLAPTSAAVAALRRRGRPERVRLSPLGVDVDRFDWDDLPRVGPPRIVYVGTLDPGRGVGVLIRAMAAIKDETDARLVLAGSMAPQFAAFLDQWIRELGVADRVELLGVVEHEELPALYASATACVVPAAADVSTSPLAVYPSKLLEYMACRTAIVAPRRATVMQIVEDDREALLFEPGDPVDLGRAILRALADPTLRKRLAYDAYDKVRRDFTASAARRAVRHAYDALAERFAPRLATSTDAKVAPLLVDDDEPTVFEEALAPAPVDTGQAALEDALASLDNTSSALVAAAPPRENDVTMERAAVAPPPTPSESGRWMLDDEVAPIEADAEPAVVETSFVAGEIDVPAPPVGAEPPDPDTGAARR